MVRVRPHWSSRPVESACVRSGRDNIHALRPTPEPGLLVPETVQTADGMDGLHGNVGPHRLPRVHLLVVSMESTGVYWRPVGNVFEGRFDLLLANATHEVHDRQSFRVQSLRR
jgi:hypothetical protein